MEEKTIADCENEKLGSSFYLIGKKNPGKERTQSTGSQKLAEEPSEPIGYGRRSNSAEGEPDTESGQ